jgi:hypothetical protein
MEASNTPRLSLKYTKHIHTENVPLHLERSGDPIDPDTIGMSYNLYELTTVEAQPNELSPNLPALELGQSMYQVFIAQTKNAYMNVLGTSHYFKTRTEAQTFINDKRFKKIQSTFKKHGYCLAGPSCWANEA